MNLTSVHDNREWNPSIAFRRTSRRLVYESIQILIRGRELLRVSEMLQSLIVRTGARRQNAEIDVRPRIVRIERDGDLQFLDGFLAAAARRFEPPQRGVIRGDVVERPQALGPFVLRADERLPARA